MSSDLSTVHAVSFLSSIVFYISITSETLLFYPWAQNSRTFNTDKTFLHEVLQRLTSATRCLCCLPPGVSCSWYLKVKINRNKNLRLFWIELECNCIVSRRVLPLFLQEDFLAPYRCLGRYAVQPFKEDSCLACGSPGHHAWWPRELHRNGAEMEESQWPSYGGGRWASADIIRIQMRCGGDSASMQCPFYLPLAGGRVNWAHLTWNGGPFYLKADPLLFLQGTP